MGYRKDYDEMNSDYVAEQQFDGRWRVIPPSNTYASPGSCNTPATETISCVATLAVKAEPAIVRLKVVSEVSKLADISSNF